MALQLVQGKQIATASWAINALTASYLSGYVSPFPYTGSAQITGSLGITGSLANGGGGLIASGQYSHAEGYQAIASGEGSHAEGASTIATGSYSHAEGFTTYTEGVYSHAEGNGSQTVGIYSHAEGASTITYGESSHAEGSFTQATGDYSHAEGSNTITYGDYSHAEGDSTQTKGQGSHAEGQSTIASGSYSHAEGNSTIASGYASHAEGWVALAKGQASHAEGYYTQATGDYSHAEGNNTVASGAYQHVQGQYNISSSAQSAFIIGNGTSNTNRSNLVFASGSQFQVTGSVIATQGFTGSLSGTSSWASNALTASYLNTLNQDLTFNGNLTLNGTASIAFLNVTYESASIIFSSGSNQLGDAVNDTQTLIGTVKVSGSQQVTGSLDVTGGITGSLFGTSSWASNAVTSLNALTASYVNPLRQTVVITGSVYFTGSGAANPGVYIDNSLRVTRAGGSTGFIIDGALGKIQGGSTYVVYEPYNYADATHNFNIGHPTIGSFNWSVGLNSTLSSNTQLMKLTRSGSLGILTTTPSATLDVSGSVNISGSGVQAPLQVYSGSTPLLFVSGSGNVGIGTATPSSSLHIVSSSAALKIQQSIGGSIFSGIEFVDYVGGINASIKSNQSTGEVRYSTAVSYFPTFYSNGVERMRIDTTGKVGIGTTTPTATLDVSGSVNISGSGVQVPLQVSSGSTSLMFVSQSGAIGFGTTAPSYRFEVAMPNSTDRFAITNGANYIRLSTNIGSGNPGIASSGVLHIQTPINGTGGNEVLQVRKALSSNFIQYWANNAGTTLSSIDGNGGLGIGTGGSAISASVHISGSISSSLFKIDSPSTSDIIFVSGSGNVGIRKSTPTATLDISGSTLITGSLNVSNGITGSLFGTASWSNNATTASFVTASNVYGPYGSNSVVSASNAVTASYGLQAVSSSYSTTASYSAYATTAGNGGVTQVIAGGNISVSPAGGQGAVTVTALGTNNYNTMTGSYGAFHDTGSYAIGSTTTAYSASLGQTDITNGVFTSGSDITKVYFTNAGIYNIQFSMQFENSNASQADDVQIWLRQGNGTGSASDVAFTTGLVSVPSKHGGINGHVIAGWNYFISTAANDYIQIMYQGGNTTLTLVTYAAGTTPVTPVTPSTILTAQRIDTFLSNTGSFTGSFTGTLIGTASWATSAISSSYPIAASGSSVYTVTPAGSSAGRNNTILLGASAGSGATTIYNSNFIGYGAGNAATTANQSNFVGVYAGSEAAKADNSNFIGMFAGYKATSASFSNLIGWQAGYTPDALTSIGSNNIIIGTNITLASQQKDSINLGGIIFATGSYSNIASLPSSGSQYGIGRVGINKVIPNYTLDVSGSGNFSNGLTVTGSVTTNTLQIDGALVDYNLLSSSTVGLNNLYTQTTGSYTSAFMKYTVSSGSNARAGEFMTVWNGTSIVNSDTSTTDIGNTANISFTSAISSSQLLLSASCVNAGWQVKTLVTFM